MSPLDLALLAVGALAGWHITGAALRWRRLRRARRGRAAR